MSAIMITGERAPPAVLRDGNPISAGWNISWRRGTVARHRWPPSHTRGPRDNPLHHAFVKASTEAGYEATDDYNGHRQEGMGPADMTVYKGRRWSSANAYLRPAIARGNVTLRTGVMVDQLLFDGTKCIGVRYIRQGAPLMSLPNQWCYRLARLAHHPLAALALARNKS